MKTSTKLLIILFASIPLSLYAYNYLLKQQLTAKNFLVEIMPNEDFATTTNKLPKFHHLVIDGILHYGKEGKGIDWRAPITVNNYPDAAATCKIQKSVADIVHYRVSNDTLFITFYKDNHPEAIINRSSHSSEEIRINAPGLKSVTANDAVMNTFGGFLVKDSFNVKISGHTVYSLFDMVVNKMNVQTEGRSNLRLGAAMNELHYSLLDSSMLTISPKEIKRIYDVKTDPKTIIDIQGSAADLKNLLK